MKLMAVLAMDIDDLLQDFYVQLCLFSIIKKDLFLAVVFSVFFFHHVVIVNIKVSR